MNKTLKHVWPKFKYVLIFAIILIVTNLLFKEIRTINFKETIKEFQNLDTLSFTGIALIGILAIFSLSLYDLLLRRAAHIDLPVRTVIIISFIVNALNNLIGFGSLIGNGIRIMMYQPKTENKNLIKYISLVLLSFVSGLGIFSICVITKMIDISHYSLEYKGAQLLMYAMALFVIVFILFTILKPIGTDRLFGIKVVSISTIDWILASGILLIIFKLLDADMSFSLFFAVFTISSIIGLLSMIPGGLGAFDLAFISLLSSHGIPSEKILLALLIYRFVYYIVPFMIALTLIMSNLPTIMSTYIKDNDSYTTHLIQSYVKHIPSAVTAIILLITAFVHLTGSVIILYNISFDHSSVSFIMYTVVITGAMLLVIFSYGVFKQSLRGMLMALIGAVMLCVGVLLTYGTVVSVIWLVTIIVMLFNQMKNCRYIIYPLEPKRYGLLFMMFVSGSVYTYFISRISLKESFKSITLVESITLMTVVLVGLAILLSAILKSRIKRELGQLLGQCIDKNDVREILNTYGGNYLSHLAFSDDKYIFSNETKNAFIMFSITKDRAVVLGDPVGNEDSFEDLLMEFYDTYQPLGLRIVFYQAQEKYLPLYHNFGNVFFKLGEEAVIPLDNFTLSGKKQRAFRATMNKFEKEGYSFEVVDTLSEKDYNACLRVSNHWLGVKNELSFSVGQFEKDYVMAAPVGLVRDEIYNVVGFCTFMPVDDERLSVDLIRWSPNVDLPMMDVLYINMLLYAQNHGYKYFNMGMATLSNVGLNKYGYLREKFAAIAYEKLGDYYSFSGLRHYKSKFKPHWETRYLVYKKYDSILLNIIRVLQTIHKK